MKKPEIRIGTSGFMYDHWAGRFYPEAVKRKDWFNYYIKFFDTLELNASFYRLPSTQTFEGWHKKVTKNFLFAVKAPQFITHNKKLIIPNFMFDLFFERIGALKNNLGPLLFQLPPGWKYNGERLKEFLSALPNGFRCAFEFRNESWYNDEVYNLLSDRNCAFCIYDLAGHQSPEIVTADFVYIRLHGPSIFKYAGSYTKRAIKNWAIKILQWKKEGRNVYIYFDNDHLAHAVKNALRLKEFVME